MFAIDGNDSFPVFPGGLGEQLFQPRPQVGNSRRSEDRDLVPPRPCGSSKNDAQHRSWILLCAHAGPASRDHLCSTREEFLCVQSDNRGGHHPEVGKRRISPPDGWPAEEDMQKAVALCDLLHLRTWVGNRNELTAGLAGADRLSGAFKEILLEDVRLERAARFAGNDEKGFCDLDLMFKGFDLRGVGRVQDVQHRKTRQVSEGHTQDFRAQTRSSHAEQQHVLKAARLNLLRELLQLIVLSNLLFDDVQPSQPLRFVVPRPQARVAIPKTLYLSSRLPFRNGRVYRRSQRFRQRSLQSAHVRPILFASCSGSPRPATCRRHRRTTSRHRRSVCPLPLSSRFPRAPGRPSPSVHRERLRSGSCAPVHDHGKHRSSPAAWYLPCQV